MPSEPSVTPDTVRALAAAAGLPLPAEREPAVAAQLDTWLAAANALNEKMSAAAPDGAVPITTFTHPPTEVGE